MAKRPPLSDSSFLAAVFSPKKNPVPTGLRKRRIKSVTGRKAARVKSYNAMSSLNQRVLEQTGQRDAYLRGDISIAEAKRVLRNKAVDLGIVKPPKGVSTKVSTGARFVPGDKRSRVLDHLWRQLTGSSTKRPVNIGMVRRGTLNMTPEQLNRALSMHAPEIKEAGKKGSDDEVEMSDGKTYNPFWYH